MPFSSSFPFLLLFSLFLSIAVSQSMKCDRPIEFCDPGDKNIIPNDTKIQIKYATKTIPKVEYFNTFVDVDIRSDTDVFNYRFVVCGCDVASSDRQLVNIGPNAVFVEEGPVLALYDLLAKENLGAIKAVMQRKFIFNQDIRDRINNNLIREVGSDGDILFRDLREVNPFLSIIGTFKVEEYRNAGLDIPFLVAAENQEQNPLARAEWMKLIGLVLGRPQKANKEFEEIEKRYNETKKKANEAVRRPAVFFNYPFFAGTNRSAPSLDAKYRWIQPVKDEYMVQLIADAKADYRYKEEDPVPGKSGTQVKFSTIVEDFTSADFLINSNSFPGNRNRTLQEYLEEMVEKDNPDKKAREEVEKFRAVRCTGVWSHQKRVTENGKEDDGQADDFFETAIFRPDDVLADFLQALHPYLDFDDRETVYLYRYDNTGINPPSDCPFTVLSGTPGEGFDFVDKTFSVPDLDRFQVADRLENSVLPAIGKQIDERFEVFFHDDDESKSETYVTVRVEVRSSEEERFKDSDKVARGMIEALGGGVKERNEDGSARPPPVTTDGGDGGGLSGGAIAGIVIAVIAALLVIGGFVYTRRSRFRRPVTASQVPVATDGGDYWDHPDSPERRDEAVGPFPI